MFRALAVAELALAATLCATLVLTTGIPVVSDAALASGAVTGGAATWVLAALLWVVLAVQVGVLRPGWIAGPDSCWPVEARRARACMVYVTREGIKVVLLLVLGVVLVTQVAS